MNTKFKIKKGDKVVVITGRDKGKSGEVKKVLTTESKVLLMELTFKQNIVNLLKQTLVVWKRLKCQCTYLTWL